MESEIMLNSEDDDDEIKVTEVRKISNPSTVETNHMKACLSNKRLIEEESNVQTEIKRKKSIVSNLLMPEVTDTPVDKDCVHKDSLEPPILTISNVQSLSLRKPERKILQIKKYCCNTNCNIYGFNFRLADDCVKEYYIPSKISEKKASYVCNECYSKAETFFKDVKRKALLGEPCFDLMSELPIEIDTVTLDESDDEIGTETSNEEFPYGIDLNYFKGVKPEFIMQRIEAKVKEFNVKKQLDMNVKKLEELHEKRNKLQDNIKDLQRECITAYKNVYKSWKGSTQVEEVQTMSKQGLVSVQSTHPVEEITASTSTQQNCSVLPATSALENNDTCSPNEQIVCKLLKVGDIVYCKSNTLRDFWVRSNIIEINNYREKRSIQQEVEDKLYILREFGRSSEIHKCREEEIAYFNPEKKQYSEGTRVIALYTDTTSRNQECHRYYAGVIAELVRGNHNRYLIFFDNGSVQYTKQESIRLVAHQSQNVWEDVLPEMQKFIKTYFTEYPRAMVELTANMYCKTEFNSEWWRAKVKQVDCSLVLMAFIEQEKIIKEEWIYRGSTRLAPMYRESLRKNEITDKNRTSMYPTSGSSRFQTKGVSVVNHNTAPSEVKKKVASTELVNPSVSRSKCIARKSTKSFSKTCAMSNIFCTENIGKIVVHDMSTEKPHRYRPHLLPCSNNCINSENFKEGVKVNRNPFWIPLENEWCREVVPYGKNVVIFYITPCGRRLRNMEELHRYLRMVHSTLGVDLFTFEAEIKINRTFVVEDALFSIKDMSNDEENVPIPCVNTISHQVLPSCVRYHTGRTLSVGVRQHMDTDPGFLVACDCTDDCASNSKCACRQLTINEAELVNPCINTSKLGYSHKRLLIEEGLHIQAIYECNPNCKCTSTCLNKVVQHKMKVQLQLFCTEERGWGVRALHDLPIGTFLCFYSGVLLTEKEADEVGKKQSDAYLADLDYIEICEDAKKDYESDVELDPENIDNSDEDAPVSQSHSTDDHVVRKSLYGSHDVFTMDARKEGNIARWFNHSCTPNVAVKNVFLDSHDLRFPWIGFFTCQNVVAGTELCWYYGYKNIKTEKHIECKCRTENCRRYLL